MKRPPKTSTTTKGHPYGCSVPGRGIHIGAQIPYAPPELGSFLQYDEFPYFPLTCSPQLLARPSPLRNGRAASTIWGARPIS